MCSTLPHNYTLYVCFHNIIITLMYTAGLYRRDSNAQHMYPNVCIQTCNVHVDCGFPPSFFPLLSPFFPLPPSSLHLPQSSEQEALRLLKEEKASSDSQYEAQLSALSSNLATVRQQLEGEKRKAQEMERRLHSQEKLIDGEKKK